MPAYYVEVTKTIRRPYRMVVNAASKEEAEKKASSTVSNKGFDEANEWEPLQEETTERWEVTEIR